MLFDGMLLGGMLLGGMLLGNRYEDHFSIQSFCWSLGWSLVAELDYLIFIYSVVFVILKTLLFPLPVWYMLGDSPSIVSQ